MLQSTKLIHRSRSDTLPAPAPKPPALLPKDICEAGTFCNIDCAGKYANFDAAKGCANAAKGYCCEDTKPANYPFTPAA